MRLVDDWRWVIARAWSMRVAVFWAAVGAFILVAPLLSDELKALLGVWQFGGGLFLAATSYAIARLLKQPGTDE